MIICEVLGISPQELLLGTENEKFKEYHQQDYVMVDKRTKEYDLIELYQNLDVDAQYTTFILFEYSHFR